MSFTLSSELAQTIGFVVAVLGYSIVLLFGAKWLAGTLNEKVVGSSSPTIAKGMLQEKAPPAANTPEQKPNDPPPPNNQEPIGSFSRVAGAMGAVAIVALFAGGGYWLLYTLFFPAKDAQQAFTTAISGFSTYVLSGLAMFAPYAANQFRTIFKS